MLRQVTKEDADRFLFLRSDERVMRYIDRDPVKTREDALELIEKITDNLNSNEGITWAICFKHAPQLIGTIGFWKADKANHRAEIGYMLDPEQQGKGIMQEAMKAALDYAFNTMKLHSIEANVNKDNTASMKLLEKNNFVKEAYFRENYYFNGKFLDSVIYSLLTPLR